MRWSRGLIVVLILLLLAPASASSSVGGPPPGEAPTVTEQGVPLGSGTSRQLAWLLDVSTRLPVGEAEARAHLSPRFLDAIGLEQFNAVLAQAAGDQGLRLESFRGRHLREDVEGFALLDGAGETPWHLVLVTDQTYQIAALQLRSLPGTWSELDDRLAALATNVSFVAAEVRGRGRCTVEHGIEEDVARPLGSGFKLYVLGALAHAVEEGSVSWDDVLRVRDDWKADTSGPVGATPAGTPLTLRDYALYTMYFSDNSATDHLIRHLGRQAIEDQQRRFHMANPQANEPFLMTRELTQLKALDYPAHANAYLALDKAGRRRYLDETLAPLPTVSERWSEPRHIDTLEWFGSPLDVCRAFAGLATQAARPDGEPVDAALSLAGTTSLGLDTDAWPRGWFKGGSEPGVVTRSYLATDHRGRTFVVSAMISDPTREVSTSASVAELHALTAGAFQLLSTT